jgi:hypothetical protein
MTKVLHGQEILKEIEPLTNGVYVNHLSGDDDPRIAMPRTKL